MRFRRIYVEITNRCNLSCSFCSKSKRPLRDMTAAEFDRIAGQLAGRTDWVCLHVKGEPLCHPHLPEILRSCGNHGLSVNITTNGTLLPRRQELLLASPAVGQVSVSLHSLSAQQGDETAYLDGVLSYARAAEALGKETILRLWDLDSDGETAGRSAHTFQHLIQAYHLTLPQGKTAAQLRRLVAAPHTFIGLEKSFRWPAMTDSAVSDTGFCYGGGRQLAILSDGTVTPCCLDGEGVIAFGNVFESSLEEILAGERYQRFRAGMSARRLTESLCQRCTFRLRFEKKETALS